MLSPDKAMDRSGGAPDSVHSIGFRWAGRRMPRARIAVLGLALCVSGVAAGCGGGGGGPDTPERKEKQEVVQDKMKGFMKQSKLPNRPG